MKKVLVLVCALLIVSLGLLACSEPEQGKTEITWEVNCEDFATDGSAELIASANVGDTIKVILCSNPTTGFKWPDIAQIHNQDILEQIDHEFVDSEQTGVVGASGKEVWTFKALKKGTTTIKMEYRRPWESTEEAEWTFTATITIK